MFAQILLTVALASAGASSVVIRGNLVMNEEVYRAVLDMPDGAPATAGNARLVRNRLANFLAKAGYELANVQSRVVDSQIIVDIDEGRVDKVIIRGQGAFNTLRAKIGVSLPENVFNRPLLDRQLATFARRHGLLNCTWKLVPLEEKPHVGPQLEALPDLPGLIKVDEAPRPFELHITLEGREWSTGLAPELALNSFEGLGIGIRWREAGLAFEEDRFEVRARVAGALRKSLDERSRNPSLSRLITEARYHTPPIIGDNLRSFLWLRADFLNRIRPDLALESFFYLALDHSVNVEFQPSDLFSISVGLGIENRRIFRVESTEATPPIVAETPSRQTRPFAVVAAEFWFNEDEIRRDKKHLLTLDSRAFARADDERQSMLRLDYAYQKFTRIGFHEFVIKSRGTTMQGDYLYPDEQPVGGAHLRGPFVNTFYSNRLASLSLDFRFSMVRDLVKLSVYHDGVVFRALHMNPPRKRAFFADAFGLGVHVLISDAFQLDAYYGVGFASGDQFDNGFALTVTQAY